MGLIPQAKCSRCDRLYSGLRSRCPYCGARRRKKAKRVDDTENAAWKLIIGGLLLLVLIVAIIVLLVNTFNAPDPSVNGDTPGINGEVDGPDDPNTDDPNADDPNADDPNTDDPGDEDPVDPGPVIINKAEKLTIAYGNTEKTDITMKVGENVQLKCVTVPVKIDSTPLWESSNPDIFVVLQSGLVTALKPGTATLVVSCDGISTECIVRVKAAS